MEIFGSEAGADGGSYWLGRWLCVFGVVSMCLRVRVIGVDCLFDLLFDLLLADGAVVAGRVLAFGLLLAVDRLE